MALGTSLKDDIETALTDTTSGTDFGNKFASAINSYLSGAVYADGALTYSSSVAGSLFVLPVPNTPATAATTIANGVMSYWTPAGVVAGVPASPQNGGTAVVSGTITASTVSPLLTTSLTTVFSDISGKTVGAKAQEIADAVESAVTTIVTTHTETTPTGPIGPFTGGIS